MKFHETLNRTCRKSDSGRFPYHSRFFFDSVVKSGAQTIVVIMGHILLVCHMSCKL